VRSATSASLSSGGGPLAAADAEPAVEEVEVTEVEGEITTFFFFVLAASPVAFSSRSR
jgi:hypothetical protein